MLFIMHTSRACHVYKSLHIKSSTFGITTSWSSRVTESGAVYISELITELCV